MRRNKHPWLRRVILIAIAIILPISAVITMADGRIAFLPTWRELYAACGFYKPLVPEDQLRITFFDVGNGDCILLQSGDETALIDAGGDRQSSEVITDIRLHGITRLDHVVATHADTDHIGSLDDAVRAFAVGAFWMPLYSPEYEPTTRAYAELRDALREKAIPISTAGYLQEFSVGRAKVTFLNDRDTAEYTDGNRRSAVCRVTFGDHAFLLMGDAEAVTERELLDIPAMLEADVIKIAHHGSDTSSHPLFIETVDPEIAVITCGFANSYGHPHDETLETLSAVGASVYRTDIHGAITITSDGKTLSVDHAR